MKTKKKDKIRMIAILLVSLAVIITGTLFSFRAFTVGDIMGGILSTIISLIILVFAIFVYGRGNKDMDEGYPLKDERSKKVIDKASSTAFYISLYLLLGIGFLSDNIIPFRDVSQATSVAVGCMALLFAACWIYYNNKEM